MSFKKEETKPDYYNFELNGQKTSLFNLIRALRKSFGDSFFSFEIESALGYLIRIKPSGSGNEADDKMKRINDLEKAIVCIKCEIEALEKERDKLLYIQMEGRARLGFTSSDTFRGDVTNQSDSDKLSFYGGDITKGVSDNDTIKRILESQKKNGFI